MPLSSEPVVETPESWNLKNMDPSQFHIPSHPWQDVVNLPFQSSLPLANGEDIIVFDMSSTNKKPWEGCDDLNGFSDKKPLPLTSQRMYQQKNICASRCQTLVARMPQKSPQNHM